MYEIKKIVNIKEILLIILLSSILSLFFLSYFTFFAKLAGIAWSILTVSLTFFLLTYTTFVYRRFNDKNFINRIKLNDLGKTKLKILLYIKIFLSGILFISIWLLNVYLFSKIGIGVNPVIDSNVILWNKISIGEYFYLGIGEVFMIIIFGYLLNHLFNSSSIVYGAIFVIVLYVLILSSLFYYPIGVKNINEEKYLVLRNQNYSSSRVLINTLLFPWTTMDVFGKSIFFYGTKEYDWGKEIHWFDMSYINYHVNTKFIWFYKNITWIPYLVSISSFLSIILYKKIKE